MFYLFIYLFIYFEKNFLNLNFKNYNNNYYILIFIK